MWERAKNTFNNVMNDDVMNDELLRYLNDVRSHAEQIEEFTQLVVEALDAHKNLRANHAMNLQDLSIKAAIKGGLNHDKVKEEIKDLVLPTDTERRLTNATAVQAQELSTNLAK